MGPLGDVAVVYRFRGAEESPLIRMRTLEVLACSLEPPNDVRNPLGPAGFLKIRCAFFGALIMRIVFKAGVDCCNQFQEIPMRRCRI